MFKFNFNTLLGVERTSTLDVLLERRRRQMY